MITTITTFSLPQAVSLAEAKAIFLSTAPKYQDVAGLIRKTYLLSEDGKTVGGVYHWQSRKSAEALYTPEWRAFVKGKYGCEPTVSYFASPVVVDNEGGLILTDED